MGEAARDEVWSARVVETIQCIIEGRYLSVPDGGCSVTRKLRAIADHLGGESRRALSDTVDVSGQINSAVIEAAEMMAEIAEVDRRSHSVSSGANTLVGSVKHIAAAAAAATGDARNALALSEEGRRAGGRAAATLQSIADAITATVATLDGLSEASARIAAVVRAIHGISKRIDVLSLNASVEAARAGGYSRGFTVVADEVSALAERSGKAGRDIRRRIRTLRDELNGIGDAMRAGAHGVAAGQTVIAQSATDIHEVIARLDNVVGRMTELSGILTQQGSAAIEISDSITVVAGMAAHDVAAITDAIEVLHGAAKTVARSLAGFSSIEVADLDLYLAKSDHSIWQARLADILVDRLGLREDELHDVRACRFGRWYYGVTDPALRNHPAFARIEAVHARVHAVGCQVVECHGRGELGGALDALNGVEEASREMLALVDELLARHGSTNG
ncbi:MAG: methyl-accepting chemotaxis protein [Solirubrobacterales bacterium]